jgi:hypothetical protein
MRLLNNLKHKMALPCDAVIYIEQCHITYKQVISEAKKRHNHKQLAGATNPTRIMWQLVNKKMGSSRKS